MSAPAVPAAARVAAPGRRRRRGAGTPWALLAPTLILLTALFCVPVVHNVWLALHRVTPYDALGEGQWVGLKNFAAVLGNPQTWLNGSTPTSTAGARGRSRSVRRAVAAG